MINPTDVKSHYDAHLGNFYSWVTGDLDKAQSSFRDFLVEQDLLPKSTGLAIDLGAGHGIQSGPLAQVGFSVKAVDFNLQLLSELRENTRGLKVEPIHADIRNLEKFEGLQPELIVCCGDTLPHLDNMVDISNFLGGTVKLLAPKGKLLLTFRDYTTELQGTQRFIPVKSDGTRILTCVLDYEENYVYVTDLLYERTGDAWVQKVSTYKKVRTTLQGTIDILENNQMEIQLGQMANGLAKVIAVKGE